MPGNPRWIPRETTRLLQPVAVLPTRNLHDVFGENDSAKLSRQATGADAKCRGRSEIRGEDRIHAGAQCPDARRAAATCRAARVAAVRRRSSGA